MNADLELMIVLQAQDLELKQLRAELDEAPKQLAAAQQAVTRAEVLLAAAKSALAREEVLRRSQESDIASHRAKIARLRKQLDAATSAAQITALEHEIHFSHDAIATLEEAELASMERSEQQDTAQAAALQQLASATAAQQRATTSAAELRAHHSARIQVLAEERSVLRSRISEAALSTYDRIAKTRGPAIAEAVDHKCSACQMMVRPQRWNDLVGKDHQDQLFHCETCGRILFWDPRRDAPVAFPAGERLHAVTR